MNVRYRVDPNQEERDLLTTMLSGGTHAVSKLKRAQILLAADTGEADEAIAANVSVGLSAVYRTKRRFVLGAPLKILVLLKFPSIGAVAIAAVVRQRLSSTHLRSAVAGYPTCRPLCDPDPRHAPTARLPSNQTNRFML